MWVRRSKKGASWHRWVNSDPEVTEQIMACGMKISLKADRQVVTKLVGDEDRVCSTCKNSPKRWNGRLA